MKTQGLKPFTVAILLSLTACGGVGQPAQKLADNAITNVGCKLSQSEMWNALQVLAEEGGQYPSADELRQALLDAGKRKSLGGDAFTRYVNAFLRNYEVIVQGARERLAAQDPDAWKKALAELEVGIRATPVHAKLQEELQLSLTKLENAESALGASCTEPEPPAPATPSVPATPEPQTPAPQPARFKTIWEQLQAVETPEVYGARKTLATAYQSCDVLTLKPMTSATPSVEGIRIVGNHPAGGKKREIASVASVNASHYYIKGQRLAQSSCFEVRTSPMIYDFGGKPYATAREPKVLNMFRDGGTGTAVLGIDCSAYVFSALALAGLKMDPDPKKELKSTLVHGIGSRAFKEPQNNGLRCLVKARMTKTTSLVAGDVVAINGHVVMIDEVGEDPFGLKRATSADKCTSAVLTPSGFDFIIAQSSPSKSGIGINRYEAKGYLQESSTYRRGLTAYAIAACRAKFGLDPKLDSPDLSVVRHKKTPECLAEPLVTTNSDCVESCRPI